MGMMLLEQDPTQLVSLTACKNKRPKELPVPKEQQQRKVYTNATQGGCRCPT